MNPQEKLKLVERATWESAQNREGQIVISMPTWVQITSPAAPTPFMNGVLRCEVADEEAEALIDRTLAHFRSLNLPFRWKIVPSTKPADLARRLEARGMYRKERLFGLIAAAGQVQIESPADVRVEPVTLENLEDWLLVQAHAWNVPPPGIAFQRRAMATALASRESPYENYLAYFDDEAVGSAALRLSTEYVYLMGGAVKESHRRRGIYRALTAHRLQRLAGLGLPAVVHCLEHTSAPICLKLGFEKICQIDSFEPG